MARTSDVEKELIESLKAYRKNVALHECLRRDYAESGMVDKNGVLLPCAYDNVDDTPSGKMWLKQYADRRENIMFLESALRVMRSAYDREDNNDLERRIFQAFELTYFSEKIYSKNEICKMLSSEENPMARSSYYRYLHRAEKKCLQLLISKDLLLTKRAVKSNSAAQTMPVPRSAKKSGKAR